MKTKRVFISDIHMSSKERYEAGGAWYDPGWHGARLEAFLKEFVLARAEEIKDVVLLGDVFNTWVCPHDETPPNYSDIFKANRKIIKKLEEIIAAKMSLFYINGNHDFDMKKQAIEAKIPDIHPIRYYRTGRIHAEHGHEYDIYNRPDYVSDPAFGRPIGYYISRLAASAGSSDLGILDLPSYLDDILEAAFTSQNIFESIIEAMAERAGLNDDDKIRMPGGKSTTVGKVKERYGRLRDRYSISELVSDLYQRRHLHGPADRLCAQNQFNVVVFGHTHNALIDKDWFLVEDRIYANTGSMCKDNAYCVEVDKARKLGAPTHVRLFKINQDGSVSKTAEEQVG